MAPGAKHLDLQRRSLNWLRGRMTGRGMRGALEVYLDTGYVADAVAIGSLQSRYNEIYWNAHHQDKKDRYEFMHHERYTDGVFVFEAKATRADFLSTFGNRHGPHANRFKPIGTHHWVVVAKGVLTPDDFSKLAFWGVLEQVGNGLREIRKPYWCSISFARIQEIGYTLLWK